jgi:hypothetical protein
MPDKQFQVLIASTVCFQKLDKRPARTTAWRPRATYYCKMALQLQMRARSKVRCMLKLVFIVLALQCLHRGHFCISNP